MSEPARIALRLLASRWLALGIALIVILIKPGPAEVAEWMGKTCSHTKGRRDVEQCNALDVLAVSGSAPLLIIVGGVMALALRPKHKGPFTLDFSRRR